ncbi:MAG: L,D-transpeptidase family protein [Anaerolineales bacterium]|nr:L,D-transpeptidase family protein [Anaerolineales bacterium]
MKLNNLSRRDFLKLSGVGLAGLLAPPLSFLFDDPFAAQQGRVTTRTVWVYNHPSRQAEKVRFYQRDTVLSINNTAVSDELDAHNRIWYQVGTEQYTEGYVYSGDIHPVRTILNTPQMAIQKDGLLAEVSVPYTDAHKEPNNESDVAYRMYYETTHWVKEAATNPQDGQVWYKVRDDKWDKYYYARAEHIRIISADELAPLSPEVSNKDKKIQVRLEQQIVIAYEYDNPVFVTPVSTGGRLRSGTYTTPQGNFLTYYKRPSRHMAAGDIAASGFDLPGVPWVQYITENGISFHGTFWHNDFGRPRSHGCINLATNSAKWLYRWTSPQVAMNKEFSFGGLGTKVEILE